MLVFGSLNVDHVVTVDAFPAPGETILSTGYSQLPGGKGRNQAAAVAALGGQVTIAGALGADAAGGWMRRDLADRDVDDSMLQVDQGAATGTALITVDATGENTIVVAPGANGRVGPPPPDLLDPRRWSVLLASLEVPLASVAAAAQAARRVGMTTVLNAAPMVGVADGRLDAVLAHTDVLVVNQSEAADLLGVGSQPSRGGDDLAAPLLRWRAARGPGAPVVVVTTGSSGVLAIGGALGAGRPVRFPAHAVAAASTVGAGDAFAGGLSVALARGSRLDEAVPYAVACAGAFLSGQLSEPAVQRLLAARS